MDNDIKTSQTDFSLTEGQNAPGAPAVQYGTEKASSVPVTQPQKGESSRIDSSATSQQKAGEFSLCEGK